MRSLKAFKISFGFVVNTIVLLILSSSIYAKPPVIQAVPPDLLSLRMETSPSTGYTQNLVLSGAYLSGGATPNVIVNSFPNGTSIGGKYAFAAAPQGKIYV